MESMRLLLRQTVYWRTCPNEQSLQCPPEAADVLPPNFHRHAPSSSRLRLNMHTGEVRAMLEGWS